MHLMCYLVFNLQVGLSKCDMGNAMGWAKEMVILNKVLMDSIYIHKNIKIMMQ